MKKHCSPRCPSYSTQQGYIRHWLAEKKYMSSLEQSLGHHCVTSERPVVILAMAWASSYALFAASRENYERLVTLHKMLGILEHSLMHLDTNTRSTKHGPSPSTT